MSDIVLVLMDSHIGFYDRYVRSGSTIGFREEKAVVVAQWVFARTRVSELSTYRAVAGLAIKRIGSSLDPALGQISGVENRDGPRTRSGGHGWDLLRSGGQSHDGV